MQHKFSFPRIPRLFSAAIFFIALWGGLGILLAINGMNRISANPTIQESVLGVTASESAQLTSQLAYWKKISEEKPDYRDAFIMAANLAYKLGNKQEAKQFIDRAFALDPTSPTVLEIKKLLEE